jgi:hypothetical protein
LTSANPSFASDAGLADRLLVIRLNRRDGYTAEGRLSDEIARHRDAGLSFIAWTLAGALADTEPTPEGLNKRHPDFAAFAVRIGRALGREAETVQALQAAEADKSLLNLETDTIGAALLELVQGGGFTGSAAELLAELVQVDAGLEGRMSAKRLGKRLSKLWPHLQSTLGAVQERDGHTKATVYTFKPAPVAEFAVFETGFSEKSPYEKKFRSFTKTPNETPQTPQADLFDDDEPDGGL